MKFNNGITIIGSGNVAWHLAVAFYNAKVKINKIISRNESKAKALANYVSVSYDVHISSIPEDTELVLLCVSDNAIEPLAVQLGKYRFPVAHTAASVSLSVFQDQPQRGVFYPFQTFTQGIRMGELEIPLFIEAGDDQTFNLLKTLGETISNTVSSLNSEKRRLLHVAGIMVNNFSNYFFSRAFEFLESNDMDANDLKPLILETFNKLAFGVPKDLQTGPARRGSMDIVKEHQNLIKDFELRHLYSVLSESIMEYYKK